MRDCTFSSQYLLIQYNLLTVWAGIATTEFFLVKTDNDNGEEESFLVETDDSSFGELLKNRNRETNGSDTNQVKKHDTGTNMTDSSNTFASDGNKHHSSGYHRTDISNINDGKVYDTADRGAVGYNMHDTGDTMTDGSNTLVLDGNDTGGQETSSSDTSDTDDTKTNDSQENYNSYKTNSSNATSVEVNATDDSKTDESKTIDAKMKNIFELDTYDSNRIVFEGHETGAKTGISDNKGVVKTKTSNHQTGSTNTTDEEMHDTGDREPNGSNSIILEGKDIGDQDTVSTDDTDVEMHDTGDMETDGSHTIVLKGNDSSHHKTSSYNRNHKEIQDNADSRTNGSKTRDVKMHDTVEHGSNDSNTIVLEGRETDDGKNDDHNTVNTKRTDVEMDDTSDTKVDGSNTTNEERQDARTSLGDKYKELAWKNVSGSLKHVSVGPYGVWGVDEHDNIFKRESNTWKNQTGSLKDISVGKSSVWGVSKSGHVFRRSMEYKEWQQINGTLLSQVSVSGVSDSVVWGVTPGGEVTVWKGGNTWGKVPGSFKVVSCGQAGVWGVDSQYNVFYRKGTYGGRGGVGSAWEPVEGKLYWISSGSVGEVWGTNYGKIFRREGISKSSPVGTKWKRIPGKLLKVDVDVMTGQVWGVDGFKNIFFGKKYT